jgi:catechol 2,3-dioxygenase-like lactoylglutathione lyase family enzyme
MPQSLSLTALLVHDYDDAIDFYVRKLGFKLVEDTDQGHGKRWVVVRPPGSQGGLLLAKAADGHQSDRVGDQTGGRVMLFLETDDFERDHGRMLAARVRFLEKPRHEAYGTVAVFEDLYGNRWDLIEPRR